MTLLGTSELVARVIFFALKPSRHKSVALIIANEYFLAFVAIAFAINNDLLALIFLP